MLPCLTDYRDPRIELCYDDSRCYLQHTLTAVSRSTQSSTFLGMVKISLSERVIIINDDGGCGRQQPTGRLRAQIGWLGLKVSSHLTPSLHSSNECGEPLQWLWTITVCTGRSDKYRKWHFLGSCRPETP